MSLMSELGDEILAPVKKGLYITSAVIVVGGIAVAANSKIGRSFLSNVKDAVTATTSESKKAKIEQKGEIIDVEAIEPGESSDNDEVNMIASNKKLKGEENV